MNKELTVNELFKILKQQIKEGRGDAPVTFTDGYYGWDVRFVKYKTNVSHVDPNITWESLTLASLPEDLS